MDRGRFKDYSPKKHIDWVDWLSDDPAPAEAKQQLRQARVRKAPAYHSRSVQPAAAVQASAAKPDVTININLQKIRLPKPKLKLPKIAWARLLPSKKIVMTFAVLAIAAGVGYWLLAREHQPGVTASADAQPARTTPSFQPVAPATNPQLGKFASKVTAYDGHRDIYSYADSIDGERVTISEQPLPDKLGSADQALAKIAAQSGASHPISVKSGQAFIKTDQQTGSQTVICSVSNLLLFITSSTHFQDAAWTKYIDNLQ